MPRRQRHTARRVWQRLVAEHGATCSEITVSRYVIRRRVELGLNRVEVSVPQTHPPGVEAEVDFGEFWIKIGVKLVKCWMFVMRLSCSGRALHVAFTTQGQEAFLHGHGLARPILGMRVPVLPTPVRTRPSGCSPGPKVVAPRWFSKPHTSDAGQLALGGDLSGGPASLRPGGDVQQVGAEVDGAVRVGHGAAEDLQACADRECHRGGGHRVAERTVITQPLSGEPLGDVLAAAEHVNVAAGGWAPIDGAGEDAGRDVAPPQPLQLHGRVTGVGIGTQHVG
jgi:hypothetical protein